MTRDSTPNRSTVPAPAPVWGAGLEVPIGLGCNTSGRTSDEVQSRAVLDAFVGAGGALIDTAPTYSDGESERIIGTWMHDRRNRERVIVSTKVGNHRGFEGLAADIVSAGLDESLRRLDTDYVDVLFAHYEDDTVPIEESAAAFDAVVRAGKARAVGLSNVSAATLQEWVRFAREEGLNFPVVLQPHYSLVHRQPYEDEYAAIAVAERLAVLPYRALGGGFLSGKYRTTADTEHGARGAGVLALLTADGLHLLDILELVATAHGVSPAGIALAWLLRQPTVTAPLVSATSTTQLAQLLSAATVDLDDGEAVLITAASDAMVQP